MTINAKNDCGISFYRRRFRVVLHFKLHDNWYRALSPARALALPQPQAHGQYIVRISVALCLPSHPVAHCESRGYFLDSRTCTLENLCFSKNREHHEPRSRALEGAARVLLFLLRFFLESRRG